MEDAIDTAKPESTVKPQVRIAELVTGEDGDLVERELMEDLTALTASVAAKLPKPPTVEIVPKKRKKKTGVYWYQHYLRAQLGKTYGFKKTTLVHEYGHHVDYMIGEKQGNRGRNVAWSIEGLKESTFGERQKYGFDKRFSQYTTEDIALLNKWKDQLFEKKIIKARGITIEKTVTRFSGAENCSDIVDSITNGEFQDRFGTWGHGRRYYVKGGAKQKENFANLFAILNKPEAKKWVEDKFPSLMRDFESALKQFDATGEIL
tara:strand:- start:8508 stop:9293 length:786 start_codon:yes stop_codon:yes gene_type:complete